MKLDSERVRRARHVMEPVLCRACHNSFAKFCHLNKLIRPCRCLPICELCLQEQIEENLGSQTQGDSYYKYRCQKCEATIYYRPEFQTKFISIGELESHERFLLIVLALFLFAILAFGLLTLIFSIGHSYEWVGITVFIVCMLLVLMLIPNILNRFGHKFYVSKRVTTRKRSLSCDVRSGVFFNDIILDE